MTELTTCRHCGAAMADIELHLAWHAELLGMVEQLATGTRHQLEVLAGRDAKLADQVREAFRSLGARP